MAEQRRYHNLGYKYTNTSVKLNEHFDWFDAKDGWLSFVVYTSPGLILHWSRLTAVRSDLKSQRYSVCGELLRSFLFLLFFICCRASCLKSKKSNVNYWFELIVRLTRVFSRQSEGTLLRDPETTNSAGLPERSCVELDKFTVL